ncbi:MAG: TonB-dependent receptor, partial [Saprospiraceae bacterium]
EFQLFDNDLLLEASNNLVKSIVLEAEHEIQLDASQHINGGINFINNTAVSNNFEEVLQRYQYAAFLLYSKNWNDRFKTNISGRGTYINDLDISNFSGEVSQSWQALDQLGFELAFSKNFKAPTFNDLYWPNSGNPNLQPENGYNLEFNSRWNYQIDSWKMSQHLTGFSNHISNWIQWLPVPPDGQFRPVNHKFVWSRGISAGISAEKAWKDWNLEAGLQYTLTKSTVLSTNDEDPNKVNQQLIYVPLHAGKANVSVQYKKWSFDYLHHLVGSRFTNPYNTSSISGFQTADLNVDYSWKMDDKEVLIGAGIQNLWNKEYEIVAYYPMPPRSFSLSLNYRY